MTGSRRRALTTCRVLEDGSEAVVDIIPLGELFSYVQGYPCALVLAVTTLDLLVDIFLNLAFENASTGRLVEAGTLEDMSGIDPIVESPAHYMFLKLRAELIFVHRDLNIHIGD